MNKTNRNGLRPLKDVICDAKRVANEYRSITGRPLGITGEIAEYEAVRLLGLEIAEVRQPGYDALRRDKNKSVRIQIKGRRLSSNNKVSGRLGKIDLNHEWDIVVLVLLDVDFEPLEIYEANRAKVEDALLKPSSISRNVRGQLGIRQFISISQCVWRR